MSDSSPLMLQLGATPDTNGSALPMQTGQTGDGSAFSGMLQSAIQQAAQTPTVSGELKQNMLQTDLLGQILAANGQEGDIISLSQYQTTEIIPLTGGNSLPLLDNNLMTEERLATQMMPAAEMEELNVDGEIAMGFVGHGMAQVERTPLTESEIKLDNRPDELMQPQQALTDEVTLEEVAVQDIPGGIEYEIAQQANPATAENPNLQQAAKSKNIFTEEPQAKSVSPSSSPVSNIAHEPGTNEQTMQGEFMKQTQDSDIAQDNNADLQRDGFKLPENVDVNRAVNTVNTGDSASARINQTSLVGAASAYAALSAIPQNTSIQHAGPTIATLTIPPENPAWSTFVGERVQWMANQNMQMAHIKLNPPELGALEISVQVDNDRQTTVSFSSPHTQVRDAIEAATPKLREMFGENGLTLGNVNVSHQSMSQQHQARQEQAAFSQVQNKSNNQAGDVDEVVSVSRGMNSSGQGMLDLYA